MTPTRTHQGDHGPAVRDWQAFLVRQGFGPGKVDGAHGAHTEAASVAWEHARPPTPSQPPKPLLGPPGADSALVTLVCRDTSCRTAARTQGDVRWIVLHSSQCDATDQAAKGTAGYLAGQSDAARHASSHYVVGPTVVIQQVPERSIAWTEGPANDLSISIEMAGWSVPCPGHQPTDWLGDGLPVLRRTAGLCADICARWAIPVERADVELVRGRLPGITTHAAITEAYGVRGGHVDPGGSGDLRWPWGEFLAYVRAAV